MEKKRLLELAGVESTNGEIIEEGLTPVNWNNVAAVLAMEIIKKTKKQNASLFDEDFEYVIDSLEDELPDFIIDTLYQKTFPHLKREVKAIQKARKGK